MVRSVLALVAVLALAGCGPWAAGARGSGPAATASATATGSTPDIAVARSGQLRLQASPPPASHGPAGHATGLAFVDAQDGWLVTGGPRLATATGTQLAAPALIQVTHDAGASWTTIWQDEHAALGWIGFADRQHGFAAGVAYTPGAGPEGAPLLLRSVDGGASWQPLQPQLPASATAVWPHLHFVFVDADTGWATVDPDENAGVTATLLRTADGGRSWTAVQLPDGAQPSGGLAFPTATTGFLTATTAACAGELYATRDGGLTWQAVAGSCEPFALFALSFVDASDGFAAGGLPAKYGNPPWQAVLATTDGGRSWQVVYRDDAQPAALATPFASLRMVDAQHGWAVTGTCVGGQNTPCGGELLTTADGGRSWTDSGRPAFRLTALDAAVAWVVPPEGNALWFTADGGRTWRAAAQPADLDARWVASDGGTLYLATAAGLLQSVDGGRSWSAAAPPLLTGLPATALAGLVVGLDGLMSVPVGTARLRVSHDAGQSWREVAVPLPDPGAIAAVSFADPLHGWVAGTGASCTKTAPQPTPLLATADGGASWRPLPPLPLGAVHLAAAPGLLAATGSLGCAPAVAVSRDGGHSWSVQRLPAGLACLPAVADPDVVWLACDGTGSGFTATATLLVSTDGGASWSAFAAEGLTVAAAAVLDAHEGWMVAGSPGTLWHTLDGGRSWQEVWPRMP